MQCVLLATHGVVSPNPAFVSRAFGSTFAEFLEILAMPDRYIIWRNAFESHGADDWRSEFRKLSERDKVDFLDVLAQLNKSRSRERDIQAMPRFRSLIEHYYPGGRLPENRPPETDLAAQGLSTGYDYQIPAPSEVAVQDSNDCANTQVATYAQASNRQLATRSQ